MHPNERMPRLYNVNNTDDEDFCEKKFPQAHNFADGVFTIGCCCEFSITYGFELMLYKESARQFFRFLLNRKINYRRLRGVIYDYSCGLLRYCLNREPLDFEGMQFLVDGVHVAGQKRLKKEKSSNRKGGHLGCSESFDFNKHKSAITKIQGKTNSQGREQMHSILEPLAKSLRQKNYRNFMKTLIAFFAIRNLKTMKKL